MDREEKIKILKSLSNEARLLFTSSQLPKEEIRQRVYESLGEKRFPGTALWWCHALAHLWLMALDDSDLFPDLESCFGDSLTAALAEIRQDSHKTRNLEEYALWLQAQLLHFFWNGQASEFGDAGRREIAEIESLAALILELAQDGDFDFFSDLAFPPSFIAQDWSVFQERRLKILDDQANPPPTSPRRSRTKLTHILSKRWATTPADSHRRLG